MSDRNRLHRGLITWQAWIARSALLLCSLLGFGWSGQAFAQSPCEIQYNSSSYQVGAPNATLAYTFNIIGSCPGAVSGTVAETADTTGQFSADTTAWSGNSGDTITVNISFGSNNGSFANYQVDCTAGCSGGTTQLFWTAQVENSWDLSPTTRQSFVTAEGQPVNLGVRYLVNGAPSNLSTDWSVDDPNGTVASPNVPTSPTTGIATNTFQSNVAGTYVVTVTGECPPSVATTTCPPNPVTFTIRVLPARSADLSITKTDSPDPVAPGAQLSYSIAVSNAGPDAADSLTLSDNLPAGLAFSSLNAPAGWSCSTPPVGSSGTVSCTKNTLGAGATSTLSLVTTVASTVAPGSTISNTATIGSRSTDPDSSNDSSTTTTTVAAAAASLSVTKVLTGTADNDNSGAVSAGDRLDYKVTATNNGNVPLTSVVVSDDHFPATQNCATLAIGASCILTGSYVVTASDVSAGQVTNIGSANSSQVAGNTSSVVTPIVVVEPVSLAVGSGDGQSTPVNTPFPQPLTVIAGGTPIIVGDLAPTARGAAVVAAAPGITINWQVLSGSATVQFPSTVTNASGVASNNAFAGPNPGPIVIRATRADDTSVFADFHLTATAATSNPSFSSLPNLTANQQAVADALDAICGSGGYTPPPSTDGLAATTSPSSNLSDLLARCDELAAAILTDPDGVIAALDEMFADIALVQSESSLLAAESQFDNIKARIAALRSGTNRTSFGGLALNTSSGSLPIGGMFQGLLDQDADKPEGGAKEVGADFSRWGFFAAGTIGRGDAKRGELSPSYDFDINGLTVGADYRKSDKLIFGATLGYTKQDNDLTNARGSLGTKGWSVSGYGTWYQASSWYVDGVLSYGRNSYDMERRLHYTITGPGGTTTIDNTSHASGDGDSLTFALSVGRDFNKGPWGFGPYLRAMYTKMSFDSLNEEFDQALPGNGFALALDTRDVTSMTSTLGGKLTYAHSASWGVLIPHLQLEWQHEFETDPSQVEARFLFDPTATPFTIHGDPIDQDFFRFGLGMSFVLTHGRSGFFYYERLINRERFAQNSLALGIRLEF